VPFADELVAHSSCYVLPIMLSEPDRQGELRISLRTRHGVQTSLFYPPVHTFTAYRERFKGVSLPVTELTGRSEVTLPLFPHMSDHEQDRVVDALAQELGG
jgi:dTDP-4-amino-4,6-dideoxygalactose transaminase